MKNRLISGFFGISLLFLVLYFFNTFILNIAVCVTCSLIVYEILCATKMFEKFPLLFVVYIVYSLLFPFLENRYLGNYRFVLVGVFIIFNIFYLLKNSSKVKMYSVFFCCFFSIFAVLFMCNIIYIRSFFNPFGIYYVGLLFLISWICDAGAYFVGLKFGKIKLAPRISPKKTVEGAIGGIILTCLFVFLYNLVFFKFILECIFSSINFDIRLVNFNIIAIVLSTAIGILFSIVGDLVMSVFKRQNNIKDFGNIIRGHGGVLDRFDSFIFVSAVLYPFFKVFPIIVYEC